MSDLRRPLIETTVHTGDMKRFGALLELMPKLVDLLANGDEIELLVVSVRRAVRPS
jgi:hypothetical protein